jgi:hypothetical protein
MIVKFDTKAILGKLVKLEGKTYIVTGIWLDEVSWKLGYPTALIQPCDSFGRTLEGKMVIAPVTDLIFL